VLTLKIASSLPCGLSLPSLRHHTSRQFAADSPNGRTRAPAHGTLPFVPGRPPQQSTSGQILITTRPGRRGDAGVALRRTRAEGLKDGAAQVGGHQQADACFIAGSSMRGGLKPVGANPGQQRRGSQNTAPCPSPAPGAAIGLRCAPVRDALQLQDIHFKNVPFRAWIRGRFERCGFNF